MTRQWNRWFGNTLTKWDVVPLRNVARLGTGHTPSRSNDEYWQNCDIPWVTVEDIRRQGEWSLDPIEYTEQHVSQLGLDNSAAVLHSTGTVMLSRTASIGLSCIIGKPMATTQAFVTWTPDERVLDGDFLHAALKGMGDQYFFLAYGATHLTIYFPDIKTLRIPLPPLDVQRRVASYLKAETARIEALVAEQERLIELLREKRQAVISHAVTKGLDPTVPMKDSGVEWLGEVPGHWGVAQLKNLAGLGHKSFTDGDWIEAPFITNDGVRLIQTGNIGIGVYKEQGFRYVSTETATELACTPVQPRDVLICRLDGPVGRACLAPDLGVPAITSVDNAILKTARHVDPEFVVGVLSSAPWLGWIEAICRVGGGFRLRISRSQLGEQRLPLPPLDEQRSIAAMLAAEAKASNATIATAENAIELLRERRSALISAAVTGQIDVRGVAPEAAS